MNSKIVILDDSVILYQHFIYDDKWEKVLGFPRGGLSYLISNNNIKFYAYIDYFYRNCLMTMDLPIYIVDEELGIDGEYSDIEELTELLNRIFPALNGDVDLTPYLKKTEAATTYQPIGDYLTEIPDNYVTDEDLNAVLEDYLTKDEADETYQPIGDYLTKASGDTLYQSKGDYLTKDEADETYQPIGNYLTEHQPLKTINNQSLIGTGNIQIEGGSGGTVDAYTKQESDDRFQPKGNYALAKDLNDEIARATARENYVVQSLNEENERATTREDNIWNDLKAIEFDLQKKDIELQTAINTKLNITDYTAPVQSDWNATSGLAMIKNKPTIPTVPSNVSAFSNDAGYITESSQVFNNYYTTGDTYNKTQIDNYITNLQTQINNLIDSYSECCTAMTLSGTAVIYTTSATQVVDTGSITNVQIFASPKKTIYPAATGVETSSLGSKGNVPCTFKLVEGITYLGQGTGGHWKSTDALKYQFNGGFTGIGQACFSGCTRLQILDFHDKVTEIKRQAFNDCTSLRTIIFRSTTPPTLEVLSDKTALDELNDVNSTFIIKVPESAVDTFKNTTGWSIYSNRIEAIS